jgi:hypothetical protein
MLSFLSLSKLTSIFLGSSADEAAEDAAAEIAALGTGGRSRGENAFVIITPKNYKISIS